MLRNLHRLSIRNILRCRPAFFLNSKIVKSKTCSARSNLVRLYASTTTIDSRHLTSTDINVDHNSETIALKFDDGTTSRCPFVWLRDYCRCHTCYEQSSGQKSKLLEDLDLDIHPINTELHTNGQSMTVNWSDGHKSEYLLNWLKDVKFPASMDPIDGLDLKYWGAEMTRDKVPTFSFHDIMSDESSLYSWLASLHTYGINIVNDLGDDDKNLIRLSDRVTYPRTTCHGIDFGIKQNPQPTNLGYTGNRLGLHTDLVYYSHLPGVLALHCIQMSEYGGSNEFADGFKVAYDLKSDDPEAFEILSTVPLSYLDDGVHGMSKTNYVLSDWKPIIRVNENGQVAQIAFGYPHLNSRMNVDVTDVKKVYRAMKEFYTSLYRQENLISFKLQPGEAVCVNNIRTLHGRSEISMSEGCQTPRHVQGIYIDWDEIYSRMRGIRPPVHTY